MGIPSAFVFHEKSRYDQHSTDFRVHLVKLVQIDYTIQYEIISLTIPNAGFLFSSGAATAQSP